MVGSQCDSRPAPAPGRARRTIWWRSGLLLAALLLLLFPADAYAYIDPGTGSLAYQMALALLLGLSFVFRRTWQKALLLIGRLFRRGPRTPPDIPPAQ